MIDIQAGDDTRGVELPEVGISGVRHYVLTGDTRNQRHVIADLSLSVSLPAERRGTHMSRLVELVLEHDDDLTLPRLPVVVKRLLSHLDAEAGAVRVAFPLVTSRPAPVTGAAAANVHDASLAVRCRGEEVEVSVEVAVVATSLCPCSKAISAYGAHNQRSRVTVSVAAVGGDATTRLPSLDELVTWVEDSCSCPVYPLLKRPDEQFVTERAYENPVFVEDIARGLALRLQALEGPGTFSVRVVNEESIHRHDAFANVTGQLRMPSATGA